MPEDQKDKLDETNKINVKDVLTGVLGWVQTKKATAVSPSVPQTSAKSPWSWIIGLVIALIVFVGLAVLAWYLWKYGRKIAELKHKIDVTEEEKQQSILSKNLATEEELQDKYQEKIVEAEAKIYISKTNIKALEKEREKIHRKIDDITSWNDLDNYVKKGI